MSPSHPQAEVAEWTFDLSRLKTFYVALARNVFFEINVEKTAKNLVLQTYWSQSKHNASKNIILKNMPNLKWGDFEANLFQTSLLPHFIDKLLDKDNDVLGFDLLDVAAMEPKIDNKKQYLQKWSEAADKITDQQYTPEKTVKNIHFTGTNYTSTLKSGHCAFLSVFSTQNACQKSVAESRILNLKCFCFARLQADAFFSEVIVEKIIEILMSVKDLGEVIFIFPEKITAGFYFEKLAVKIAVDYRFIPLNYSAQIFEVFQTRFGRKNKCAVLSYLQNNEFNILVA